MLLRPTASECLSQYSKSLKPSLFICRLTTKPKSAFSRRNQKHLYFYVVCYVGLYLSGIKVNVFGKFWYLSTMLSKFLFPNECSAAKVSAGSNVKFGSSTYHTPGMSKTEWQGEFAELAVPIKTPGWPPCDYNDGLSCLITPVN